MDIRLFSLLSVLLCFKFCPIKLFGINFSTSEYVFYSALLLDKKDLVDIACK